MSEVPPHLRVELREHDSEWETWALRESERLAKALGPTLVEVHHIGSTAIAGIMAKPIIDLIPVVRTIAEIDEKQSVIEALGYRWRGEFGIVERRFCVLTDPETERRIAHLHIFEQGSHQIARHLVFRDYLRAHPDEVHVYEGEKLRAQAIYPDDSQAYSNVKSTWIQACNYRAAEWASRQK